MEAMVEMPRKNVPPPLELVKGRIEELLPPDAKREIDAGEVLVVDVRDSDRYEKGHVAGAVNISSGESARGAHDPSFVEAIEGAGGSRQGRLIVFCGEGNRSARTADALRNEHGFESAASVIGGLKLWNELGLPVEGEILVGADDAELGEGMEGDAT
ncbi:MAG: rhodanese-like domain-containing protein [Solirubrobacterales bacterium]